MSFGPRREKTYPYRLGRAVHTGGRKLLGVFIKARNVPGVLAEIARTFASLGANIRSVHFNPVLGQEDVSTGFIVVDLTGLDLGSETLAGTLRSVEGVMEVRVVEPGASGVILDLYHFPVVGETGERYVLTEDTGMRGTVEELRRMMGTTVAAGFLYYLGIARSKHVYRHFTSLGASTPLEHLNLLMIYAQLWGRYRGFVEEYRYQGSRDDRIVVRLEDNWECMTAKRLGLPGPASYLERGIVAGLLSEATGRRVKVEETRCIAKGDPYCEFRATFRD